jgi:hypothetical protein
MSYSQLGFIISTILIKLSFGTEGIMNTILIVTVVLFGVIILAIHNKYETLEVKGKFFGALIYPIRNPFRF